MPRAQPLRGQAGAVCETDRRPGFPIISEQPVSALLNDVTMLHGAWGLNQPFDSEVAAGRTESVAERRVSTAGAAPEWIRPRGRWPTKSAAVRSKPDARTHGRANFQG